MAGNKTDNGVHEIGTDDILASYQADTPGELETSYLKDVNEFINIAEKKKKEQEKTHFSMVFDNPLKGFPYNEQYGFDKTLEESKMGEIYAAIQMGYTAKELNNDYGVGLAQAKTWIGEYWAAKRKARGSMKKESVDITEGTWAVPDSIKKINTLNDLMKKPHPMKKAKDADTAWKKFANLVGDDGVADAWYFQGEDGEGDARDPVVDWLGDWGFKVAGYRITHAPGSYVSGMDDDDRDSAEVEEGFFQNMWKKIKNKGKIKKPKGKDAKAVKVK